jgi:hypothetical protein
VSEVQVNLANVLILGTAEWDSPVATNQHYVTRELARVAAVDFVESLGLRRPKLTRADLTRMAGRLRRSVGAGQTVSKRDRPDKLQVVSPLVVPIHRTATRPVNRMLLRRSTAGWLRSRRPRVLWTFTPVTYGLEAHADVTVYHCVDLLAQFPGVDGKAIARGEQSIAAGTSVAIATSTAVHDHLRSAGFGRVVLLPNVADVSVFTSASRPAQARRPAILFAGNLSPHKLDVALLESVAEAVRGRAELILAGPVAAGGGSFDGPLRRLEALGARYLGMLSLAELAEVAGGCRVGLVPYAHNDYTKGVSPLKCFEYLASGLGVVGTRLPEIVRLSQVNPHVHALDVADIPAEVVRLVESIDDATIGGRIHSAAEQSWDERGRVLRQMLQSELDAAARR